MNSKISVKIEELYKDKKIDDIEYVRLFCLNSITVRLDLISIHLNSIKSDLHGLINKKILEREK